MQKVLSLKDKEEWNELTKGADIFFTPGFFKVAEKQLKGRAEMFVFDEIIQPYIKRSVSELPFYDLEEEYYDIVSPEFCGPLSKTIITKKYFEVFHDHCIKNNLVAEYTRLNPFLNNQVTKLVNAELNRKTIYVDLTNDEKTIWAGMKKANRNAINKAIKEGVKIKESGDSDMFYNIYIDTMKRLGAGKENFYDKKYFVDMFKILKDNIRLFVAEFDNKIITASLFLIKKPFITYYLSGFLPEYSNKYPNNLLLYSVISWAKQNGFKIFNLTGGRKIGDSLHKFKESFSNTTKDYYVYCKIHNKEVYDLLCDKKASFEGKDINKISFFPAYRG